MHVVGNSSMISTRNQMNHRSIAGVHQQRIDLSTGTTMVFDDSYMHTMWNCDDRESVLLVLDLWHPDLGSTPAHPSAQLDETAYWMTSSSWYQRQKAHDSITLVFSHDRAQMKEAQKRNALSSTSHAVLRCLGLLLNITRWLPAECSWMAAKSCTDWHDLWSEDDFWRHRLAADFGVTSE